MTKKIAANPQLPLHGTSVRAQVFWRRLSATKRASRTRRTCFSRWRKTKPEKGLDPSSPKRQEGMRTERQTHAKPCAAETEARRGENKRAGVLSRLPVALAASRPFCKAG